MNITETADREKINRDRAKKAVTLAMRGKWEDAARMNQFILDEFPRDLEAHNRLGKALSELGRNREAREAFQNALEISPYNRIARKNLERLVRLGDEASVATLPAAASPDLFIEESGASTVTTLFDLAPPSVLLKLAPGHPVKLEPSGGSLNVTKSNGEYVGRVEPRLATRLAKLTKGGNRYEANARSSVDTELTIIIREAYKHPSQAGVVSFPSRPGSEHKTYMPGPGPYYDKVGQRVAEVGEPGEAVVVKDWSDDDTEPGDDAAFSPTFHRIINPNEEAGSGDEDF